MYHPQITLINMLIFYIAVSMFKAIVLKYTVNNTINTAHLWY